MIKIVIILAILMGAGLPILVYRKSRDLKELFISLLMLIGIVSLLIVGGVMRAVLPMYLSHMTALALSYVAYILYLVRQKFYWYIYLLPFATLIFYIILAFLGNRHISTF